MAMSTYLQNAIINAVLRNTSYTSPVTVYLALYTTNPTVGDTGTEANFGGYTRQAMTFTAPSNGVTATTGDMTFPVCISGTNIISHIGIRDADTAGNLLFFGALTNSQTINVDNQLVVEFGDITNTLT